MSFSTEDKMIIKHYCLDKHGVKRLLKKFPNKGWAKGGLRHLLRKIDKTGDFARIPGSGRTPAALTNENVEEVKVILSQGNIGRTIGTSQSSVSRICRQSLGLTAFHKTKVQDLSDADKLKRVIRTKRLLRFLAVANAHETFFIYEKLFKFKQPRNTQYDRVYATKKGEISTGRMVVKRKTFPKNVIISVGVSKLGRTSVFFLEPGVKINGQYYRNELLARMLPEMNNISRVDYIFLQDGARSHTAKTTLEYLNEKCPAYVKPDYWPPNSPDFNVLDFIIWGDFEKKVWKNKPHDVESLKQAIIKEWRIYSQEIIDNAIDSFRKRLRQIINADGGYIEHYKR